MRGPAESENWTLDQWNSFNWQNRDTSEFNFLDEKGDLKKLKKNYNHSDTKFKPLKVLGISGKALLLLLGIFITVLSTCVCACMCCGGSGVFFYNKCKSSGIRYFMSR